MPPAASSVDPGGESAAASMPMQLAWVWLAEPTSAIADPAGPARARTPAVMTTAKSFFMASPPFRWQGARSLVAMPDERQRHLGGVTYCPTRSAGTNGRIARVDADRQAYLDDVERWRSGRLNGLV